MWIMRMQCCDSTFFAVSKWNGSKQASFFKLCRNNSNYQVHKNDNRPKNIKEILEVNHDAGLPALN